MGPKPKNRMLHVHLLPLHTVDRNLSGHLWTWWCSQSQDFEVMEQLCNQVGTFLNCAKGVRNRFCVLRLEPAKMTLLLGIGGSLA